MYRNYVLENGVYFIEESVTATHYEEVHVAKNPMDFRRQKITRIKREGQPGIDHKPISREVANNVEIKMKRAQAQSLANGGGLY